MKESRSLDFRSWNVHVSAHNDISNFSEWLSVDAPFSMMFKLWQLWQLWTNDMSSCSARHVSWSRKVSNSLQLRCFYQGTIRNWNLAAADRILNFCKNSKRCILSAIPQNHGKIWENMGNEMPSWALAASPCAAAVTGPKWELRSTVERHTYRAALHGGPQHLRTPVGIDRSHWQNLKLVHKDPQSNGNMKDYESLPL